jgi:hypothetical protein
MLITPSFLLLVAPTRPTLMWSSTTLFTLLPGLASVEKVFPIRTLQTMCVTCLLQQFLYILTCGCIVPILCHCEWTCNYMLIGIHASTCVRKLYILELETFPIGLSTHHIFLVLFPGIELSGLGILMISVDFFTAFDWALIFFASSVLL